MRRTDQEFKAEVLRRSSAYREKQKQQRKKILTTALCFALVIFGVRLVMPMLSMGSSTEAAVNGMMEAPQSPGAAAFFADKCAPMEMAPESAEEKYAMDGSMMMTSATGASRSIPEDFSIRFIWGVMENNIFDTGKGEIQKDLVTAGTTTAEFEPTEEMLTEIFEKIQELDITSIDRDLSGTALGKEYPEDNRGMKPLRVFEITIVMDGETYLITGDENAIYFINDEEAARFMEFVNFMIQLVQNIPEYQSLPDAVGGYE